MTVHYADDQVTLHAGDSLDVLRTLPDASVNCVVTSPPYFGLRDYGEAGQYGLEGSPAEYVETMRGVFAEVRRVLAADGTLWLNLGDSYSSKPGPQDDQNIHARWDGTDDQYRRGQGSDRIRRPNLPPKNLLGMPWRVAFALQADGWILRNAIVWDKPNAMPESVIDRLSTTYEHVFLFARSPRYWFDLDPIKVPYAERYTQRVETYGHRDRSSLPVRVYAEGDRNDAKDARGILGLNRTGTVDPLGRNPGDVWEFATQPFPGAHFAVMPPALAERCVIAGCKPGGVVLDPFCGSGTTGLVALKHGRRFVGIDLSATYLDLALRTRLAQGALIELAEEVAS